MMGETPIGEISTQALAYLGDCVIELYVRTHLVREKGLSTSAHLNTAGARIRPRTHAGAGDGTHSAAS